MLLLIWLVLCLVAVSLILLPLALWRREIYKQYSGSRLVACPESQQPAAVSIDVRHAAATGMDGCPDLRLSDCTRWPERSNCDQACLSRAVQAGPYTLGEVKVGTKQIYHLPIVLAAPSIPSPLLRRPARAARQLLHAQGKTDRTNSWPASPLQLTEQQIGQLDAEVAALLDSHRDAVMRLAEVPGLGVDSAQQIVAEVGSAAETFASSKHLSSWAGVCPGDEESAGVSRMEHRTRSSLRAMAQKGWNPRYIFRHSSPSEGFRHPPSETSLYRSQFDSWATLAVSAASSSMWEVESHPRRRRIDPPSRRSYVLI